MDGFTDEQVELYVWVPHAVAAMDNLGRQVVAAAQTTEHVGGLLEELREIRRMVIADDRDWVLRLADWAFWAGLMCEWVPGAAAAVIRAWGRAE